MNELVAAQLEQVQDAYGVEIERYPDGVVLVSSVFALPPGWNKSQTRIWVVVPVGYPVAKPDCFWTEQDLRLQTGSMPNNTGNTHLPHHNEPLLWFSWHATKWNPNKDTLLTYLRLVEARLRDAR